MFYVCLWKSFAVLGPEERTPGRHGVLTGRLHPGVGLAGERRRPSENFDLKAQRCDSSSSDQSDEEEEEESSSWVTVKPPPVFTMRWWDRGFV